MTKQFEVTRIDIVKSSMIKLVAFHEDTTFVQFKNDTVYTYTGTKEKDYNDLINAKSVGAHLASEIKGNFDYAKVEYELKLKEISDDNLIEFIGLCFNVHLTYEDLSVEEIIGKIKGSVNTSNDELVASEVKKHKGL